MIRRLCFVLVVVLCMAAQSDVQRSRVAIDFRDEAAREQVHRQGRQSFRPAEGHVLLRGSGSVFTRDTLGPGEYYIRFSLHEPEDFEYHSTRIVLFAQDPEDPSSDHYYIRWRPHGEIGFGQQIDGERTTLMRFIDGGRDNPNRIEPGEPIDLALRVPREGDGVFLYCGQMGGAGEPTTGFKLTGDVPLRGSFGVYNTKWYSHAQVHRIAHRPLRASGGGRSD